MLRSLAVLHLPEAGGPAQHVRPWLAALAARGTLEVVAPAHGPALDLYASFAETRALSYSPLVFPSGVREQVQLAPDIVRDAYTMYSHLRRTRPDLVVVVTSVLPAALVAARMARVPAIVYVGEIFNKGHVDTRARSVARGALARLTVGLAHAVICCSRTVAQQFTGFRGAPVTTIYPGIDVARVGGAEPASRATRKDEPVRVAVAGNITPARGQDLLIRALPLIRQELGSVRCVIAGATLGRETDVRFRESLTRLARALDLESEVEFAGFIDPISELYEATDLVVNPVRVHEALGLAALEAIAAGLPVVAARVGAVPEVLTHERNAILVEPDDPAALAAAVVRLWRDDELRTAITIRGKREVLERFAESTGTDEFCRVVDRVLGQIASRRDVATPSRAEPEQPEAQKPANR